MTSKEYADSLRKIADFYEAHPEVPLPYRCEVFHDFGSDHIRPLAKALRSFRKEFDKDYPGSFAIVAKFGKIEFRVVDDKANHCTARQVGVRQVPEKYIPAHEEPVYEWDCSGSLLDVEVGQ